MTINLTNSAILAVFQGAAALGGWLLGDNGYLLHLLHHNLCQQRRFNDALSTARTIVEHSFNMLKMHFRCLDKAAGTLQTLLVMEVS